MEPLENTTEEDKLTLFMEWLLANRLQVGLAIVIALGVGAFFYQKEIQAIEAEEMAAEDLLAAISPDFQVDDMKTNQPVAVLLNEVAKKHPGTKAAKNAQFLAASALYDEGKFTEAAAAFRAYLGLASGGPLAAAAQFGLAASEDALGEKEKAQKGYEEVISRYGKTPEALQARVVLAKLLLANPTPDGAAKARDLLLAASQESQAGRIPDFWGREAERMLTPLQVEAKAEDDSANEKPGETEKKKPVTAPSGE